MDQSSRPGLDRMRSTTRNLTSSTLMTLIMPTTATKSMSSGRVKLRNHPRLCLKSCNNKHHSSFRRRSGTGHWSGHWSLVQHCLLHSMRWLLLGKNNRSVLHLWVCVFRFKRRWSTRPWSPRSHLLSLSSWLTLLPSLPLIWTWWSWPLSLSPVMAVSFSRSWCKRSRGTTSLTFCDLSTACSTTLPSW